MQKHKDIKERRGKVNRKNKGKKQFKSKKLVFTMTSILIILILIATVIYRQKGQNADVDEEMNSEKTEIQGIKFPYLIEEEKLEIASLFTYSGLNPDADMQEGNEVAAIEFKNVSDDFLEHAAVKAVFSDGSEQTFVIENLPAGKETLAFSVDNQVLLANESCVEIVAETIFGENMQDDCIAVSTDGMTITVENISEEDLSGINIYYRDVCEDKFFGGITHQYTIETLPKGENTTFSAQNCIWGVVEVVRTEVNK